MCPRPLRARDGQVSTNIHVSPDKLIGMKFAVKLFSIALFSGYLFADTIVDVGPASSPGYRIGGPGNDVYLTSWTQSDAYSSVSISAAVASTGGSFTFDAYLSTAVGPGAGSALVDSALGLTPPTYTNVPDFKNFTLFTNETLGAGTYYLTLFSSDTTPHDLVRLAWGSTVNVGTGITLGVATISVGTPDTVHPWESTFSVGTGHPSLTVTGTLEASAPEPSTLSMFGIALIGLALARRK